MKRLVPIACTLGLGCIATVQASTHTFDFNSDPAGILNFYGNAQWFAAGGAGAATNANDGFLEITAAVNSQRSAIVFDDFDNGQIVQGFTFEADLRIGNGSTTPADGFSLNYVRSDPLDPVLSVVAAGGNPASAGTDPNPPPGAPWIGRGVWATGPNNENNLPEEGTWTGLSVGFDAWDSGGSPPYAFERPPLDIHDIIGVDIRVDGYLIAMVPMPTLNGTVTDATSMQTGPNDGSGTAAPLGWAHLKVDLDSSGALNVWWKGVQILTNFATGYVPSPGRLVFAGRTGGANQIQDVDNIVITTVASATVSPGNVSATFADGCTVLFYDSGAGVVDTSKGVSFRIDGGPTLTGAVTKSGINNTAACHAFPTLFAPGSTHTITASVTDTFGRVATASNLSFTVPSYPVVAASLQVTGVNTAQPGFRIKPWQSGLEPNNYWWANEQLAGLHGAINSLVDLSQATDGGYIDYQGVINFNYTNALGTMNENGNFTILNGYEETQLPGIATDPTTPGGTNVDNCALEILTFLKFSAPGVYRMGVNSDDGFNVTVGSNPQDWGALSLGSYLGGKGASDVIFQFVIPAAGIYPVRLVWENGNGGANLEWFSVLDDGTKILVNDPSPTNTTGIAAYFSGPTLPAYVSSLYPYPNSTVGDATRLSARLTDLGSTVTPGSLALSLNGVALSPNIASANGVTTLSVSGLFLPAPSTNTAQLVYRTSAGGPFTNTWTYVVPAYTLLQGSWAVTGVDTTQPGFRIRPWQSGIQPNTVWYTEEQLAGEHGDNLADLTLATDGGYIDWTAPINFKGGAGTAGDFGGDVNFPGIPGSAGEIGNQSMEVLAYLYLDHPGFYGMGVNSDDGFKVTAGANPRDWFAPILGEFNGGKGPSDSLFYFVVTNAGYYPFRLIWENGNGSLSGGNGYACEWFIYEPDGTRVLINDTNPAVATGVRAYLAGPPLPAYVSPVMPTPTADPADPYPFSAKLTDGSTTVTPGSVKLLLNGVDVRATVTAAAGVTTVSGPGTLPTGTNTAQLIYSTSGGGSFTNTWAFTVPPYVTLDSSWMVSGVDTTKTGFRVRPWQSSGQPNTTRWTREQLRGLHGANQADLSTAGADGYIVYTDVINWDTPPNHDGNFQASNGYQDITFPGGPAAGGTTAPAWDNAAEEVLTFLHFSHTGTYIMGVNSDDGFLVSAGSNPMDWFAPVLGEFSGGRGATDTLFRFVVTNTAGYYPFRLQWENGNGGYNCEWFTVQPDGTKILLNDPSALEDSGVQAYYAGPNLPAYVSEYFPDKGASGVASALFAIVLQDGSTSVNTNCIGLTINGTAVTPVVKQASGQTTVTLNQALPPGTNAVTFSYCTSAGSFSDSWSFVVTTAPTVVLSTNLWAPPGSGSNPGFALKVFQTANTNIFNGWANVSRMADMAVQGLYGPNVADLTQYTNHGELWWPGVINFSQNNSGAQTDNGDFRNPTYPDASVPGIGAWTPPAGGPAKMDNAAWVARMFLEFPQPGLYLLGVNSDDGFRLTVGDQGSPGRSPLAILSPASIAGEMTAMYTTTEDEGGNNGFGITPPSSAPLFGQLVLCDPINASTALNNASAVAGNIAVCYRGPNFQIQARNAANAGAIAVIGGTFTTDSTLPGTRGAADSTKTPLIPCLNVGYPDFATLTNAMAAGPVLVRLTAQDCSPIVGKYDNGRGASDTLFGLQVPRAGVYPFRLVWENGGGDANCEFFTMDPVTQVRTLVNDPAGGVKAWITRDLSVLGPPARPALQAASLANGRIGISWTGQGELWESYSLTGPWFKSTFQSNPAEVAPDPHLAARYFRVRQY